MRHLKIMIVSLAVCLAIVSSCMDEGGNNKKVYYIDKGHHVAPFLLIQNNAFMSDFDVLPGDHDRWINNLFFNPTDSEEDLIIYSLVIEDNFTGNGDFTELENIEVWTDFQSDYSATFSPDDYYPDTLIAGPVQPLPGPTPGTLVLPFHFPIVLSRHKSMMMTITADIAVSADNTTPGTHTIKVVDADVYGIESNTYLSSEDNNLVIENPGVRLTLDDRGLYPHPDSPLSKLLAPSDGYQDVLKFNVGFDDAEDVEIEAFRFEFEGNMGYSYPLLVSSSGFSAGYTTYPVWTHGPFNLSWSPRQLVPAGSKLTMTLKICPVIGSPQALDGDSFQIKSVKVIAYGHTSGARLDVIGNVSMPRMHLQTTYPVFSLGSDSPSGALIAGIDTPIAVFKVAPKAPSGYIRFTPIFYNSLTVSIKSRCSDQTANDVFYLKDESGTIYASSLENICSSPDVHFVFDKELVVWGGTSKKLIISADTIDLASSGDFIQAFLSEDDPHNLNWPGSQYDPLESHFYGDIIFRGNIYANTLVVP